MTFYNHLMTTLHQYLYKNHIIDEPSILKFYNIVILSYIEFQFIFNDTHMQYINYGLKHSNLEDNDDGSYTIPKDVLFLDGFIDDSSEVNIRKIINDEKNLYILSFNLEYNYSHIQLNTDINAISYELKSILYAYFESFTNCISTDSIADLIRYIDNDEATTIIDMYITRNHLSKTLFEMLLLES